MTRIYCELYTESIEGVVVRPNGSYVAEADLDLDSSFIVRCDDDVCFTVHGWMVDVEILATEIVDETNGEASSQASKPGPPRRKGF